MRISWIKYKGDNQSFRIFKNLGLDVVELEDLEKTDDKIKELIDNNFNTIVLSNEVACFSGDIIKKYGKDKNVNIIITPSKTNNIE